MNRSSFNSYLSESNFRELFISEMGWNNPSGATLLPEYVIDEKEYNIEQIADCRGFQILHCEVDEIPTSSACKKLDTKLRKNAEHYICIFSVPGILHHLWVTPVKKVEKRDLVLIDYDTLDKASFLFEKMEGLTFSFDTQPTILDVVDRVQRAFIINSEKITKDFYAGFKKEHTNFVKFISGIDDDIADKDNKKKQWYTSVMLNRLMFCYFIQKKEFLNGDVDYLRHKLEWTQKEKGEDRFFSTFYKGFLVNLFHDGLNTPIHDAEFEKTYGRIPYLNGGMFDVHQLENEYKGHDIADEAFISLFDFFDKWHWHLDDRMTATGKDINPDVLGYIFEQYINSRAEMGAYYTKEDITEYIGRNTILPFLIDTVSKKEENLFKPSGDFWTHFRNSGDRYVFDTIKKGNEYEIPEEITVGLDSEQPNLIERRKKWKEKTPEQYALPTEIWRDTIERLESGKKIKSLIESGQISSINDLITYNLDIRQFVSDYLEQTNDVIFIGHFYDALKKITILDPTCGSGAFLFAALNILEPLYQTCITRMQEFHEIDNSLFNEELNEITDKYRSNIQYFIYKSIILRNLYGVDIMVEATEIAKLRLFLKMVAVVEVDKRDKNLGLDPLPDIDFNIRCGNTLIGYATENELERDLLEGDMFAIAEFKDRVHAEMDNVASYYKRFKEAQLVQEEDMASFKKAKYDLREHLKSLNDLLNHHMHSANASGTDYNTWLNSTQPFHWLAEYYDIINGNGGFDVIIGNPPYVSMSKISYIKSDKSFKCSDLYGFVIRRVTHILRKTGYHGFIVMHNLAFSRNFNDIRNLLLNRKGSQWYSFYSRIPSGLFSGDVRVRNCIYLLAPHGDIKYTSRLHRWFTEQRGVLFTALLDYKPFNSSTVIPMLHAKQLQDIYESKTGQNLALLQDRNGVNMYFKKVAYNFLSVSIVEPPAFDKNNHAVPQSELGCIKIDKNNYKYVLLLLCGKFFVSKWLTYGDDFHLSEKDLLSYSFPFNKLSNQDKSRLDELYEKLVAGMPQTVQFKLNAGVNVGTFNTSSLWNITDESDMILFKYITDNPEKLMDLVESHLAKCVISGKA